MKTVRNASLHFTLKGQNIKNIKQKLTNWLETNEKGILFISDTHEYDDKGTVLHHCFMNRYQCSEKRLNTDIIDMIDSLTLNSVSWYDENNLDGSRKSMLKYVHNRGGVAIFVGEIKDDVRKEYDMAKELGMNIIEIK